MLNHLFAKQTDLQGLHCTSGAQELSKYHREALFSSTLQAETLSWMNYVLFNIEQLILDWYHICVQGIGAAVGQLDSPWGHLAPLFGLHVTTIMFTDQLLFLIAIGNTSQATILSC